MRFAKERIPFSYLTRSATALHYSSRPRELAVLDAVRLIRGGAETCFAIDFVVGVVSLKPDDAAFTFKGEDVGRHTIEKPAVVRDHDSAAGEIVECFFESSQRIDVEIVGRLVQQQDVRAFL